MKLLHNLVYNHAGPIGIAAMVTWGIIGYLVIDGFPVDLSTFNRVLSCMFIAFYFIGMQISWFKDFSSRRYNELGLLVMAVCVIGLGWSQPQFIYLVMIVVFAGIMPYFFSLVTGAVIVVALYGITMWLAAYHWQFNDVLMPTLSYLSFSAFAFFASYTAQREVQAREELAVANQQLLATQQLLTDSAVNDERLRISRDLHDAIGHHLTAMSLQLEVARKLAKDKALEHVEQAHSLTKLLLADVREVVSDLRDVPSMDIRNSLSQLVSSAKAKTNLVIDSDVDINKSNVAETLFRLVQEMITNSNRYSQTGQLNIYLSESDQNWDLACDDGGSESLSIEPGAGILGMRERVEKLGGQFVLTSAHGLRYQIQVPKYD